MFRRRSLLIKLLLLVGIPVLALAGLGAYGIANLRSTFADAENVQRASLEISLPLNQLRQTVLLMVIAPSDELQIELYNEQAALTAKVEKTMQQWDAVEQDVSERELEAFGNLRTSWEAYKETKDFTINRVRADYREEAFINALNAARAQYGEVNRELGKWTTAKVQAMQARYVRALWVYSGTIVLATVCVAGIGFVTTRSIFRPLALLKNAATRIARNTSTSSISPASVLDERIDIQSKDELGELASAFNQMVDNLRAATEMLTVEKKREQVDETAAFEPIDFPLHPPEQSDELGRLGDYRVLEQIGVGGMGVVFRAEDSGLKRQIALKVMKPSEAANRIARERFVREAQATAAIEHDNIVRIYQVDEDHGIPFIAMQFLRGEALQSRMERVGRLDQRDALRIGREIAGGLAAAHVRGLIHRDIKPDNVWLEEGRDRVKILDFGLAGTHDEDAGLTQTGVVVGTPKYMSPEQARGESVDHRCDLFSLGSVLYQLVSGKAPFERSSLSATLIAVSQADCQPIEELRPELLPELAKLITRLLSKDREQRPQSAADVARAIADIEEKLAK